MTIELIVPAMSCQAGPVLHYRRYNQATVVQ